MEPIYLRVGGAASPALRTYIGKSDAACIPCPPGFMCDYIPLLDSANTTEVHTLYGRGETDGDYLENEKYLDQLSCPTGSLMSVDTLMLDTQKDHDFIILSSTPFAPDFVPYKSLVATSYIYVGSGDSDLDDSLQRRMVLPYPDLYLMFYSDGMPNQGYPYTGFDVAWSCLPGMGVPQPVLCPERVSTPHRVRSRKT